MTRPHTLDKQAEDTPDCEECLRDQKVDAAIAIVSMFLESTRLIVTDSDIDGTPHLNRRQLEPKESAAYAAALNFLECYMDSDT